MRIPFAAPHSVLRITRSSFTKAEHRSALPTASATPFATHTAVMPTTTRGKFSEPIGSTSGAKSTSWVRRIPGEVKLNLKTVTLKNVFPGGQLDSVPKLFASVQAGQPGEPWTFVFQKATSSGYGKWQKLPGFTLVGFSIKSFGTKVAVRLAALDSAPLWFPADQSRGTKWASQVVLPTWRLLNSYELFISTASSSGTFCQLLRLAPLQIATVIMGTKCFFLPHFPPCLEYFSTNTHCMSVFSHQRIFFRCDVLVTLHPGSRIHSKSMHGYP